MEVVEVVPTCGGKFKAEVVRRTQNVLCYGGYEMALKRSMMDVVGVQDMRTTQEVI